MASTGCSPTVTAETARTSRCLRCNAVPEESEPQLQRCAKCHARNYSSHNCQRVDWPKHKKGCSILASGGQVPNRRRTTMRINMSDMRAMANENRETNPQPLDLNAQEPNTIYYLKTTHRKLNAVAIKPPTPRFTDVLDMMCEILQDYGSDSGLDAIHELANSPGFGPRTLVFFNAPLADGSVLRFDIIREEDAEVSQALSHSQTFTVRCATPLIRPDGMIRGSHGNAQVKGISVFKTFTSRTAALDFARTKFTELQSKRGDPILRVLPTPPDNVMLPGVVGIIERAPVGAQRYDQLIELRINEPRA